MPDLRDTERLVDIRYAWVCACIAIGLPVATILSGTLRAAGRDWAGAACYPAWLLVLTLAWHGLSRAGAAYRREHLARVAADLDTDLAMPS